MNVLYVVNQIGRKLHGYATYAPIEKEMSVLSRGLNFAINKNNTQRGLSTRCALLNLVDRSCLKYHRQCFDPVCPDCNLNELNFIFIVCLKIKIVLKCFAEIEIPGLNRQRLQGKPHLKMDKTLRRTRLIWEDPGKSGRKKQDAAGGSRGRAE